MAMILDKLLPVTGKRAVKLQLKRNWLQVTSCQLPEIYQEKREKVLAKYVRKANRKLRKPAFDACDKELYATCDMEQKLQKYDTKAYLSYRAAEHKAAKEIFSAVLEGRSWQDAVERMHERVQALDAKRETYVQKLTKQKEAFLAKHTQSNTAAYHVLKTQFDAEYERLSEHLELKHGQKILQKQDVLHAHMDLLSHKIAGAQNRKKNTHTMQDDVVLRVEGLKMYFGGLKAVDDLSFDVKKGEIFGLIGPNGAGKTTVFNCITQFYKPTDGKLLFRTKDDQVISLTDYPVHDIVLKGIVRTFQNLEVVKEVSVLDNLLIAATRQYTSGLVTQMFHLPLLGKEEKLIRAKADKILKYMDLTAYRNRLCWGLPYGVLKRVEIARALMCDPQLIILDEPAAGLNESETRQLAVMINHIRHDFGCTVLLVEHDMSLVMNICDHICAISFGKKLAYGTASQIQSSKEVQEAYLGTGGA